MVKKYAPIYVSVYDRFDHFKALIESLLSNPEAQDSILYISSDGALTDDKVVVVDRIRNYAKQLVGFKEVILYAPTKNTNGSIIATVKRDLFSQHDAMIRLEDDNVVSNTFLRFMNDALRYYEAETDIFAICGYVLPGCEGSDENVRMLPLYNAWGYAIWKDRWITFDPQFSYLSYLKNLDFIKKTKNIGLFLFDAIYVDAKGYSIADDARVCAHVLTQSLFCVYPPKSLVRNTGLDGTGVRAKKMRRFNNSLANNCEYSFHTKLFSDEIFRKAVKRFMDRSFFHSFLRILGIYRFAYFIRSQLR